MVTILVLATSIAGEPVCWHYTRNFNTFQPWGRANPSSVLIESLSAWYCSSVSYHNTHQFVRSAVHEKRSPRATGISLWRHLSIFYKRTGSLLWAGHCSNWHSLPFAVVKNNILSEFDCELFLCWYFASTRSSLRPFVPHFHTSILFLMCSSPN